MRARLSLGKGLIRLGRFIQSLALMAMKPDDLVEINRQKYANPGIIDYWTCSDLVDTGLGSDETALMEKLPLKKGKLLLLGMGGGRDAIALARMGFEVTGIDFIPEMVGKAMENAARHSVTIEGLVQEISQFDVPDSSYDVGWLTATMYSCVPTRKKRVTTLKRIRKSLRAGGYFLCQFQWNRKAGFSRKVEPARKIFAILTLGNRWYEKGDTLWGTGTVEFQHAFTSGDELRSEVEEGGFEVVHLHIHEERARGGAIFKEAVFSIMSVHT